MTKEEQDQARWGCSEAQRKARLLYCMDYLMHALNDEEAIEPWLVAGAPDGLYQASKEPPAEEYEAVETGDGEFDRMVGLFIKVLAHEGGYRDNGLRAGTTGRAVLS